MTDISKLLKIRYVKIHFTIRMIDDCVLPIYKASALRGGMGEMLMRSNCIGNRDCEVCGFSDECLVQRVLYSKMEIKPAFMNDGDSVGYVIECENYREEFKQDEELEFSMLLFGKTICWFAQILNALYSLGINGIGADKAKFDIVSVTNTLREKILDGNDIDMRRLKVLNVEDYVEYRKEQISRDPEIVINFKSPLSLKYKGEILRKFDPYAIIESACRRIYMLDCFEGVESDINVKEYMQSLPKIEILNEEHRDISVKRYSNRKKSSMYLNGIEGSLTFKGFPKDVTDALLAGELIHIGKNTSFGFGRYRIK